MHRLPSEPHILTDGSRATVCPPSPHYPCYPPEGQFYPCGSPREQPPSPLRYPAVAEGLAYQPGVWASCAQRYMDSFVEAPPTLGLSWQLSYLQEPEHNFPLCSDIL